MCTFIPDSQEIRNSEVLHDKHINESVRRQLVHNASSGDMRPGRSAGGGSPLQRQQSEMTVEDRRVLEQFADMSKSFWKHLSAIGESLTKAGNASSSSVGGRGKGFEKMCVTRMRIICIFEWCGSGITGQTSSVIGGLELRLQQMKLDDETMHSIVGMLAGDLFSEGNCQ